MCNCYDRGRGGGGRELLGDRRRRRLVAPDLDAESIIGLDAVPRRPGRPINKAHARLADAVEQHVLARDARREQLLGHGIDVPVYTNQGPKGPALQAILDEYQPSRAAFIDDLSQHHGSVFAVAAHVRRLHLCAEPLIAPHISCALQAGHAHARIDTWDTALPWLIESLTSDEKDLEKQ